MYGVEGQVCVCGGGGGGTGWWRYRCMYGAGWALACPCVVGHDFKAWLSTQAKCDYCQHVARYWLATSSVQFATASMWLATDSMQLATASMWLATASVQLTTAGCVV